MPFSASISTASDTAQAVEEVCLHALEQLGTTPELAIVFYSPHHLVNAPEMAQQLMARLSPKCLVGTVGEAIVANRQEIEQEPAIALWLGSWNGAVEMESFHLQMERTPDGPTLLGWPDTFFEQDIQNSLLLGFGDPYTFPTVELFLPRLEEEQPRLPVMGGMASNPQGQGFPVLIRDHEALEFGGIGLLLRGKIPFKTVVSQGCRPIGRPLIITRAHDNIIQELSGKTPLDYLRGLLEELPVRDRQLLQQGLLLGLAISEYRESFGRGDFLIRNLLGLDPKSGALAVTDRVRVGQTVQFQVRDAETADEDLKALLRQKKTEGGQPKAGLVFTCNGRGTRMFPEPHHDAQTIQTELGPIPLAGFFAAGELGPIGGSNFIHGFTASIVLFE